MKRILILIFALSLSAHASTWRSTRGEIFSFQPGGKMQTYASGKNLSGTWWWVSQGEVFSYRLNGSVSTVTFKGKGAVCRTSGSEPVNWTQMARRSGAEEEDVDNESWFMPAALP